MKELIWERIMSGVWIVLLVLGVTAILWNCSGCTLLEQGKLTQGVGQVILLAYDLGGAEHVNEMVDRLVAEGRLTEEQAEWIKSAAQRGADELRERLEETEGGAK